MKKINWTLYIIMIFFIICVCPVVFIYIEKYNSNIEEIYVDNENDYARITDIDYKAVVLDEEGNGGNILVTERITYDIHAEDENDPFWELWRDLPEKNVDGLDVRYNVQSVKQILDDGTEIVYEKSPKLYWDDSDFTDKPYGPGKWYHSGGPYDGYYNYECVLFYVDGLYREQVTFEIQYIMTNASFRYSDVSQLYLTLYADTSIKHLNSYKAQILVKNEDMPKKRNYYASTYGTKDYKFDFSESNTLNPGYHTFVIDLDKDELKFDRATEYLEFSFISFNEDVNIFTEHAPDNYYSDYPYLEALKEEIEDYYNTPYRVSSGKKKVLLYSLVGSILVVIYIYMTKKNLDKNYTIFKPTTKIQYFRDIPSDLDPHFASFLVFSKGRKKDRLSDTLSAIMLSLARKQYIELVKIDPSQDWSHKNIKLKVLYIEPIVQKTVSYTPGIPSIPNKNLQSIEKNNESFVNNIIRNTNSNSMINNNSINSSGITNNNNIISSSNPGVQITSNTSTTQYNSLLATSSRTNPTLTTKPYVSTSFSTPSNEKKNINGKVLEKLTENESVYFNLILRYTRFTHNEMTLSQFQSKVYSDHDAVDAIVTSIEGSISKIGMNNNYFTTPKYDYVEKQLVNSSIFFCVAACFILLFGIPLLDEYGLGLAYGSIFIIFGVCAASGLYLNSIKKYYLLFSQFGEDEREKWIALYNFLNSETLMNERDVIDYVLWEKYLVYATAFGISDKVSKALKIRCPEHTVTNSPVLSNSYYRTSSFRMYSRSMGHSVRSSSNTSRMNRYHGGYYGGGGSYGGGGRGGGGGGGGH